MRHDRDSQGIDLTVRIKSLEQFTGSLVTRPQADVEHESIPIHDAPLARVPRPRRSRIFLRNGEGHGVFADLTVTAPLARPVTD